MNIKLPLMPCAKVSTIADNSPLEKNNSPCVRNCCLNEEDICLGCFRSIDEIIQWNNATEQQKKNILSAINGRKVEHTHKYNL
jgi:predicted Fe-S protein YdhL (DUF1289 family)